VQVYRLITSKTYEEQMFERASKKLGMEHALFSKGAFNQEGQEEEFAGISLRGLTDIKQDSKEIEKLLKFGAYAILDEEDAIEQHYNNMDIDDILKVGKRKDILYSKGQYTLQKSTFNATKYENKMPDVNDPDFWQKVLPMDAISISMLEKRLKKEKKEMANSEKMQTEFIKDLEIAVNDFFDAKFDLRTNPKELAADEEKLREILRKIINMPGVRLSYVEKCREWVSDLLSNRRKKGRNVRSDDESESQERLEEDSDYSMLRKRTSREAAFATSRRLEQLASRGRRGKRGRGGRGGGAGRGASGTSSVRRGLTRTCKSRAMYEEDEDEEEELSEYDDFGDEKIGTQRSDYREDEEEDDDDDEDYQATGKPKGYYARKNEKNGIICS